MRLHFLVALLAVATTALAWTTDDHEIFDLVSDIEAAEGKGTTFYSWLDVPPTASGAEIGKAYRKKSMVMHPDKNPGVKGIQERFARLGVVAQILRNTESRERYDFFYKNGVPRWRGTGYYYSRFRPGLGTVIVFLGILTSGLQYIVQRINYKNDLTKIDEFVKNARTAAWGPKMTPLEGRRKVKVPVGRVRYDEDGNARCKQIDMIVDGDDVFILEPNGDLLPLDTTATTPPSIRRTWVISLATSLYHWAMNRSTKSQGPQEQAQTFTDTDQDDGSGTDSDAPSTGRSTPVGVFNTGQVATKVGGQRRKFSKTKKR